MRPIQFSATAAAVAISIFASPLAARAQSSVDAKSSAIAASFSKFKSLSREKRGIKKEKYLKVESEPAVLANPADYSGKYEVPDMQFSLELNVNRDGTFTGTGYEPLNSSVLRRFTLRDGRIDRAYLRATKVYADGSTERLEGAFMNRSTYQSPTDKGVTVFGFGTMGRTIDIDGMMINKFFYQKLQ